MVSCEQIPDEWQMIPDNKVHGANMGPIWGRQDPGGPQVGPMNFAIWDVMVKSKWFKHIIKFFVAIAELLLILDNYNHLSSPQCGHRTGLYGWDMDVDTIIYSRKVRGVP